MRSKVCQFFCTVVLLVVFLWLGVALAKTALSPSTQSTTIRKIHPITKNTPLAASGISLSDQRKLDLAPLGHVVKIKSFGQVVPAVKFKPGNYYILEPKESDEDKPKKNKNNTNSSSSQKPKGDDRKTSSSQLPTLGDEFDSGSQSLPNASGQNFDDQAFGNTPGTHPECRMANLPAALNLNESLFGAIRDQHQRGTCTAQTVANIATYVWNSQNNNSKYFSANWIHMRANEFEILDGQFDMNNIGTGSSSDNYRDVNLTGRGGFMEESFFPYLNPLWGLQGQSTYVDAFLAPYGQQFINVTQVPPLCSFSEAQEYQAHVEKVTRSDVSALEFLKIKLCQDRPVYASFDYYSGMLNSVTAENGYVLETPEAYTEEGGHVMTIVGYDDTTQQLRLLNSWGNDFGNSGYFYMTYDAFLTLRRNTMLTIHELQAYPGGPKPVLYQYLTSAPLPTCDML